MHLAPPLLPLLPPHPLSSNDDPQHSSPHTYPTMAAAAAGRGTSRLPPAALAAKVQQYEQFANDVLKADLAVTLATRARLAGEIEELEELRRSIAALQDQRRQVCACVCVCIVCGSAAGSVCTCPPHRQGPSTTCHAAQCVLFT
jgi:hypothetical protein